MSEQLQLTEKQMIEMMSITKIGCWVWELETGHVTYSKEWAEIVGYSLDELVFDVSTWENMLLRDDLEYANSMVEKHVSGQSEVYEAEFRMVKKDGSIIWGHDKGKITEYDKDGKPLVLCGVLQDITHIKATEVKLRESTEILNLAISAAEFGTWDWDIVGNKIEYNKEYLRMLGYTEQEIDGSLEEWESMIYPADLETALTNLDNYVSGKTAKYECEIRMIHKDGTPHWTKDIGTIVSWDSEGNATRLIGGHLNIDSLKRSQENLENALKKLEDYQLNLEEQIAIRAKTLVEQDRMLIAVNNISQRLVALNSSQDINEVIEQCLHELCEATSSNRISIWRNKVINNELCCYPAHRSQFDFVLDENELIAKMQDLNFVDFSSEMYSGMSKSEIIDTVMGDIIPGDFVSYNKHLPTIYEHLKNEKMVNVLSKDLSVIEYIFMALQGIKSLIISPIYLNGEHWGFIGIDDCAKERIFSDVEENMISISGTIFANAIQKVEFDEQLRLAHEEALMSSQAKSNFLANMSHEIRTPMNAISGMAEIILRESKEDTVTEYASGIKNASSNLIAIINDILDFSKIESGKLDIVNSEYDLAEALSDVINMSRVRLENKSLGFFAFIDSSLPTKLFGDEIRIKQILINLLVNAIKFTSKGHIGLNVTGEYKKGKVKLKFEVYDSGIGIKEEDAKNLFEEFERVNTKKNRNIEGTGLGLAITKKLCEMMNGSIKIDSVYRKGSTFTVVVEQEYDNYQPIATIKQQKKVLLYDAREQYIESIVKSMDNLGVNCVVCQNQSMLYDTLNDVEYDFIFTPSIHLSKVKSLKERQKFNSKIVLLAENGEMDFGEDYECLHTPISCIQLADVFNNITSRNKDTLSTLRFVAPTASVLVVDDNSVNLKVAQGLMKPYSFKIETAMNGLEAVELIKKNVYDVIFMDHMMPVMDGIDATVTIRKLEGDYFKNVPIIALTANAILGTKELFIREGMNDFLAKPIETTKLNDILLKWIPKEKQEFTKIAAQAVAVIETDIKIKNIDVDHGINLLGGSVENYVDIIRTYYSDGLKKQSQILEMYQDRDINAFRTEVHAIKSASASIGALQLSDAALRLEQAAIDFDLAFIDSNVEFFLDDFNHILEAIRDFLGTLQVEDEDKAKGEIAFIKEQLPNLEEAIQLVEITKIENILGQLIEFDWGEQVSSLLKTIEEHISSYEYDEALPLIDEINKLLFENKN